MTIFSIAEAEQGSFFECFDSIYRGKQGNNGMTQASKRRDVIIYLSISRCSDWKIYYRMSMTHCHNWQKENTRKENSHFSLFRFLGEFSLCRHMVVAYGGQGRWKIMHLLLFFGTSLRKKLTKKQTNQQKMKTRACNYFWR